MGDRPRLTTVDELDPPSRPEVSPALRALVAHQFLALVDQHFFPCLGGKAATSRRTYLFNLYQDLTSDESLCRVREDLRYFTDKRSGMGTFCTFAASFVEPARPSEDDNWNRTVWSFFERLRLADRSSWDDRFSRDPHEGDFALSLWGCGYLAVSLYPGATRYARRFAWPTVIFNPAEQDHQNFPEEDRFLAFRDRIRDRDARLQGFSNPSLPPTPDFTQASGFSGVPSDPEDWRCPISMHISPEDSGDDAGAC